MVENVVSVELPVGEHMVIPKNRLQPDTLTGKEKRICIVTGTHGDELEGQYVCFEVVKRIQEQKEHLKGIVDIYPAINPLGIDSVTRGVPMFDLDLNRIFPGSKDGHMCEYTAYKIVEDIAGADCCVDIHASNVFLREIPQVRMSEETAPVLLPLAKHLNVDYLWVHSAATVLQSTLAHSLNVRNTPTLVVEMGVGLRVTKEYCDQLTDGLFHLMSHLGIWDGPCPDIKEPIVSTDGQVYFVNAEASGFFIPCVQHWKHLEEGDHIGDIIDPLNGEVLACLTSPCRGMLFTLREHPNVMEGSLIARVLGGVTVDE